MTLLNFLIKNLIIFGKLPDKKIILASNHHSYIDPFIFNMLRKEIRLFAHQYVMKLPFKKFLTKYNFILATISNGIEELTKGNSLVICPSGLIEITGEDELPYHKGVIVMARATKTPIVPIYVAYSKYPGKWIKKFSIYFGNIILILTMPFWRSNVYVNIGEEYMVSDDCDLIAETTKLKQKILSLAISPENYISPIPKS